MVGQLDEDGYLFLTDRISDMVIRDGVERVRAKIEEVLSRIRAVIDNTQCSASPTSATANS